MGKQNIPTSQVAALAADWFDNTAGPGKSIWIYTDNEQAGIGIVHQIKRAFAGAFESYEIPYDTLPGRLVNGKSGNEVYVLSQPNHLDPIMTSMHTYTMAEVEERTASRDELLAAFGEEELDGTDFKVVTINPETQRSEYIRKPSLLVIDAERPWWEQLLPFVGRASQVIETERVPQERSLEALLQKARS